MNYRCQCQDGLHPEKDYQELNGILSCSWCRHTAVPEDSDESPERWVPPVCVEVPGDLNKLKI